MTLTFDAFLGLAVFWLSLCCFCGFKRRYGLFLALLFMGLCMQSIWLSAELKAAPLEPNSLMLQGAGAVCAVIAFLAGRFLGRIQDAWRDSRLEDNGV